MNDISIISLLNIGNFQLWFLYKSDIIDQINSSFKFDKIKLTGPFRL